MSLEGVGVLLLLLGLVVVLLAVLLPGTEGEQSHRKLAGVVMIGPIPVIFGSDAKWASIAIVLAVVLVALGLLFYVI